MIRICAIFAVLGWAAVGLAAGPAWTYKVDTPVPVGKPATLRLGSQNGAHGVTLKLSGPGGRSKTFKIKRLAPGKLKALRFKVPNGVTTWKASLTGSADGAETTVDFEIKVASVAPLKLQVSKKDIDLGGTVVVVVNRAVAKAEVTGFGGGGERIIDETIELDGASGRVPIEFDVPEDATVKRLEIKVFDPYGAWVGQRIVSWSAHLEHEDVIFESGKAAIQASEAPKIDGVFKPIEKEIARFKRELGPAAGQVDLKLYVAGYTDTVGSAGDNRTLSRQRARAIADYFRSHGVKLPIYYQGFGEAALAVATGDNVDNAQNRRAVYILSNVPPRGGQFPGAAWKRLQ